MPYVQERATNGSEVGTAPISDVCCTYERGCGSPMMRYMMYAERLRMLVPKYKRGAEK